MTPAEQIALRWIEQRLRVHACRDCRGTWITASTTTALFHRCVTPYTTTTSFVTREERSAAWARRVLGTQLTDAFEQAVAPEGLLRRD